MVLSASIMLTLGVLHLVYTFWGPKLTPRDRALQISMSQIFTCDYDGNNNVAGLDRLQCKP
jgi:hypothetical protein